MTDSYNVTPHTTMTNRDFYFWLLFALAAIALLCAPSLLDAQVDIQVPHANQQYIVVARNAQWGVSGGSNDCTRQSCGFNNNFVLPVLYAQEMICIVVFNSSTSSSTFTIKVAATNDPAVAGFTGNTARWSNPLAADGSSSSGSTTIQANSFGQFYAQLSGAAKVSINFSASTVQNGGADITISQEQTASYSANPGIIVNTNLGNPSSAIGGVNIVQLGVQNAINSAYQIPIADQSTPVNAPAGPASSNNPAVPVQSTFTRAQSLAGNAVNPFVIGCLNGTGQGVVTANRVQYVQCDSAGRPLVQGAVPAGSSNTGTNPVAIGVQDGSGNNQFASSANPLPVTFPTTSADPCANVNVEPSGVVINITSATTTLLVAINGSTSTYICGVSFTMVGAAETIQFVSGTQVTNPCDTGQTNLTGQYTDGTVSDLIASIGYANRKIFGGTRPVATSAQQICAVTTGTVSIKGHMSFIQQ